MMKQRYAFRDMNVFMPYVLIHVAEALFEGIVRFNDEEDRTILLVFHGEDDYDETLKHYGNQYDVINTIGIEHDDNTEIDYPMLSYDFVVCNRCSNFDETKTWIKKGILNVKE